MLTRNTNKGKDLRQMGGGAGIGIDPAGFLVTKDDEISFISTHQNKGLSAIFDKVPDLIEKLMKKKEAV